MKKKVAWLLCMAGLCLVLYTIVVSRMENSTDVIFGGAEGAYVKSDSVTFLDMNATPTRSPQWIYGRSSLSPTSPPVISP